MNRKKISLTICLVSYGLTVIVAQPIYQSYEQEMNSLRRAGDSVLAIGISITPDNAMLSLNRLPTSSFGYQLGNSNRKLNDKDIYQQARPATLVIGMVSHGLKDTITQINLASGYMITSAGIGVTNYHVAQTYSRQAGKGRSALIARNGIGSTFAVTKILYLSAEDDLAVFQVDLGKHQKVPFLHLAPRDKNVGDQIYVLGHPIGLFYFFSKGIVANLYQHRTAALNGKGYTERNTMAITADFAVGSSGSPILDDQGNVVGTVSNTRPFTADANGRGGTQMTLKNTIPVSSLKKLLLVQ